MWVFAALLFFQAANPNADGMKALDEGRYEAAAQSFTKAVESDPSDYTAHFNLALAYGFLHRDAEGIAEYRKTLELKPGLYEAELNAGILLLRQKNAGDALAAIAAAAAQKPEEFRPRYYLAQAQLAAGAPAEAEANYRKALELDAKSADAQLGLARSLAGQGKLSEAAPHFRRAAELAPEFRDGLLELAGLYEKNKQFSEAVEIYRQFPDNPAAQEHVGALLLNSKQYKEAIAELETAYAKSPTNPNRVALAVAFVFDHQDAKAVPLLEKAVAAEPANYDLRVMFARSLRDLKQYSQSAAQFAEATKLKPDVGQLWNEFGGVLYLAEEYPPALAAFDRAGQLGEDNVGNWFLRGIMLDKLHQLKPALEAYQKFLSLSLDKFPNQEFQARQRVKLLERELGKR